MKPSLRRADDQAAWAAAPSSSSSTASKAPRAPRARSVLVDSPCLSNVSQARPSASVSSRQCLPVLRRVHAQLASTSIAPPWPPPMQIEAMPRLPLLRFEHLQQVQHDARARGADRVAERDRAAVDVELLLVELAERRVEAELLAAVSSSFHAARQPSTCAAKASLISQESRSFELEAVALQDRRRRVHRAQAHLRRVEARPLRVDDAAERLQVVALHGFLGGEHQPGRAVGDLRAVARRDVAVLAVEEGLQLGQVLHAWSRARTPSSCV